MEESKLEIQNEADNSVKNPATEIEAIKQRILSTGAVDSEPKSLDDILDKLRSGKLTGKEAVMRAREIEASRQDYR